MNTNIACSTNSSIKYQTLVYKPLNDQTVPFKTIQFSVNHLYAYSLNDQTVLFDPLIGLFQGQPLRANVDLGVLAMKRYSAFSKAQTLLDLRYQILSCHIQDTRRGIVWLGLVLWHINHCWSFNAKCI